MPHLTITSIQAPIADAMIADLALYLEQRLGLPVDFIHDLPWQEREKLIDSGQAQLGWICGLPYVVKKDGTQPVLDVLAAPVYAALRYQNLPVYFSDVVVLRESRFYNLLDLRGAAWAFNEPNSHSGYNVVRWRLAEMEEKEGFFGRTLASGAHQDSLEWVLAGKVDASAIDSTVLELEVARRPELVDRLRVVEVLGPSPVPPLVTHSSLPGELRTQVLECLLVMNQDPEGRRLLAEHRLRRFAAVFDSDYEPIRRMAAAARDVPLTPAAPEAGES